MNLRNFSVFMLALALVLTAGGIATAANERPHEGKVISVDQAGMVMSVQGDKNDQWTLYWTETTKLKGDLAIQEVKVGDKVHFDFMEKDGKRFPKSGGTVKTTRRLQKGIESTVCPSDFEGVASAVDPVDEG